MKFPWIRNHFCVTQCYIGTLSTSGLADVTKTEQQVFSCFTVRGSIPLCNSCKEGPGISFAILAHQESSSCKLQTHTTARDRLVKRVGGGFFGRELLTDVEYHPLLCGRVRNASNFYVKSSVKETFLRPPRQLGMCSLQYQTHSWEISRMQIVWSSLCHQNRELKWMGREFPPTEGQRCACLLVKATRAGSGPKLPLGCDIHSAVIHVKTDQRQTFQTTYIFYGIISLKRY